MIYQIIKAEQKVINTAFDSDYTARIRSRFPGEVVKFLDLTLQGQYGIIHTSTIAEEPHLRITGLN